MSDERTPKRDLFTATDPWTEWADRAIHVIVGVLFLTAAVALAVFTVIHFFKGLNEVTASNLTFVELTVELINGLLLVLIILEVLGTVRSYLLEGHTSLKPFLIIGIISATRRVLAVGAETGSLTGNALGLSNDKFRALMVDLSVNAVVVLVLALALFFFARADPAHQEGGQRAAGSGVSPGPP